MKRKRSIRRYRFADSGQLWRRILRESGAGTPVPGWEGKQNVSVYYAGGSVRITRGGKREIAFHRETPEEWRAPADNNGVRVTPEGEVVVTFCMDAIPEEHRRLLQLLTALLEEQAAIAAQSFPFAEFSVANARGKKTAASKGGKRTKETRRSVEGLMRRCLDRGEDSVPYFDEWSDEYGYSRRQLHNIWREIQTSKNDARPRK